MNIKGYTIIDGMAVPDESILIYKKNKIFKNSGIPREYWDLSLENFTISQDSSGYDLNEAEQKQKIKAFNITKDYISNIKSILRDRSQISVSALNGRSISSNNLIFRGDGGSGKTLLSVVILKSAIDITPNVCFISWNELYNVMSDFDNKEAAEDLETKFIESDLAIVDGVSNHAYRSNTFFQRKMEYICGHRLGNRMPMIWTSYQGGPELCGMFGPTAQSYIKDAIIIKLPNGSARDNFKEV